MTQEEVDLIYEYLHEKYSYEDGQLIMKVQRRAYKKNKSIGSFVLPQQGKGYAKIMTTLYIKNKIYNSTLAHFIWIYHYNQKPLFLIYIDKNRANNRIENLKSVNRQEVLSQSMHECQGYKIERNGKFRVSIRGSDYEGSLGTYSDEKTAKDIYLIAKKILFTEALTIYELRNRLCDLHPKAKPPIIYKRKLPHTRETNNGRYDSMANKTINKKMYSLYFGTFDTAEEANKKAIEFQNNYVANPECIIQYLSVNQRAAYLKAKEEYKTCHAKQE